MTLEDDKVYAASIWAQLVKKHYNYVCAECGSGDDVMAVHRTPPSLGGKNTLENGVSLCVMCRTKRVFKTSKVRFNFSIPEPLFQRLDFYCRQSGRSVRDVIKQLVADFTYVPEVGMNGFHRDAERNGHRMSVEILHSVFADFSKKCKEVEATPVDAMKSLIYQYLKPFEEKPQ